MSAQEASRRPVRLKINRLPPEAVARVKWAQRVWQELRAEPAQAPSSPALTWRRRLACLRAGFLPVSYDLYSLAENDRRDYLSDREREMTWVLNWPYAGILDDKLGFDAMLRNLGAPTPDVHALILRGRLEPLDGSRGLADAQWWRERLDRVERLVLKPIWGAKGAGIKVVQRSAGGCRVNGEDVTFEELQDRVTRMDRYLVSDFAQQAAYAEQIFPGSANSIRILTMHGEDRVPFLAAAVHRFGRQGSRGPVDNWGAGGLSAGVDVATGTLSAGVVSPEFGALQRHDRHPDTGARITGTTITNWDAIRTGILDVARRLPFLPYVGWDVVATDSGHLILEGNKQSDVNLLQVHRPLLRDPRVRAFYAREGIL